MIRTYSFECNKCSYKWDLFIDSEIIIGHKTKCPQCNSKDTYRDYFAERVSGNSGPKTIGMLADLNSIKQKKGIEETK